MLFFSFCLCSCLESFNIKHEVSKFPSINILFVAGNLRMDRRCMGLCNCASSFSVRFA
jgi:hypothetical protein